MRTTIPLIGYVTLGVQLGRRCAGAARCSGCFLTEDQVDPGDGDNISRPQAVVGDPVSVDVGAAGGIKVEQDTFAVDDADLGVVARDPRVSHHQVIFLSPANLRYT